MAKKKLDLGGNTRAMLGLSDTLPVQGEQVAANATEPEQVKQNENYIALETKDISSNSESYIVSTKTKEVSPKQHRIFKKPRELKTQYNFVIQPSIVNAFKEAAARVGTSASAAIAEAMQDYVKKHVR